MAAAFEAVYRFTFESLRCVSTSANPTEIRRLEERIQGLDRWSDVEDKHRSKIRIFLGVACSTNM